MFLQHLMAQNTPESIKKAQDQAYKSGVQMRDAGDVDGYYNGFPCGTYSDCYEENGRFATFGPTAAGSKYSERPLGRYIKDASGRRSKLYNAHLVMFANPIGPGIFYKELDIILFNKAQFGIMPVYDTQNRIEHKGILYASKSFALMLKPFTMPVPPAPLIIP